MPLSAHTSFSCAPRPPGRLSKTFPALISRTSNANRGGPMGHPGLTELAPGRQLISAAVAQQFAGRGARALAVYERLNPVDED
jgi:hypothetical protein